MSSAPGAHLQKVADDNPAGCCCPDARDGWGGVRFSVAEKAIELCDIALSMGWRCWLWT